MNHDEISDLLGAYALDAVDPDEHAAVDTHLRECARCRAEVQDHRETAALLTPSSGDAPEHLWQRIAGSLEASPPGPRLAPVEGGTLERPRRVARAMVAALAAAAVIVAVLGVQVREQDQRIDQLQSALQDPLGPAFQAALTDPRSQVFELASDDGQLTLRGVIAADGTGYLAAAALPRLSRDRTYQLWGATGDQLISLGVLGPHPDIVTFPADPYTAFAVTEEDRAGVVASTNAPVVVGSTT
ncbi:anti-sigma factor [Rhabdothermincola sediminis]|uniref:anti-sigma factor n=1 Tax=Rhabdothermincola sediminis TaxID=2751370 RepID=UPI001AA06731|nr:anti-sigma factor [Rhabdothermincola sediminis]